MLLSLVFIVLIVGLVLAANPAIPSRSGYVCQLISIDSFTTPSNDQSMLYTAFPFNSLHLDDDTLNTLRALQSNLITCDMSTITLKVRL